jgi:hypothetical protein
VLRVVIDNFLKRSGINIKPAYEADHLSSGNVVDSLDARCGALTGLCTELLAFLCNESSSQGRNADGRACPRLQKIKQVAHPEASALEIGRTDRSCLKESALTSTSRT